MKLQGSIFTKSDIVHVPSAQAGTATKQPQPMFAVCCVLRDEDRDFPGGPVVENPSTNTRNTGSIPG